MQYRKMGKSNIEVSVIGHGTWAFGNDFFGEIDEQLAISSIHQSLDMGVNLIDTAPGYGLHYESELTVGKALTGRRSQAIISTKCGIHRIMGEYVKCLSPMVIRQEIEQSLTRLNTDYIDIYMIHWPDNNFDIEGALDVLSTLKKEGKIREAAVSNFDTSQIATAIKKADISCVQSPVNLFNRSSFENGIIDYCKENQVGIMAYGALGGGILSGKIKTPPVNSDKEQRSGFYNFFSEPLWSKCQAVIHVLQQIADNRNVPVAQVSINWVLSEPGIASALMGSTKPENAAENAKAADWTLSFEELSLIDSTYRKHMV